MNWKFRNSAKTVHRQSISPFPWFILDRRLKINSPNIEEEKENNSAALLLPSAPKSHCPSSDWSNSSNFWVWGSPDSLQLPWNDVQGPHPPPPQNTLRWGKKKPLHSPFYFLKVLLFVITSFNQVMQLMIQADEFFVCQQPKKLTPHWWT